MVPLLLELMLQVLNEYLLSRVEWVELSYEVSKVQVMLIVYELVEDLQDNVQPPKDMVVVEEMMLESVVRKEGADDLSVLIDE